MAKLLLDLFVNETEQHTYNEPDSLGLIECVRPRLTGNLGTGGSRVADAEE